VHFCAGKTIHYFGAFFLKSVQTGAKNHLQMIYPAGASKQWESNKTVAFRRPLTRHAVS